MVKNNLHHGLDRYLGPEKRVLWLALIGLSILVAWFGPLLAPVFASIVVAYLLQWPLNRLEKWWFNHTWAVILVYVAFMSLVVIGLFVLMPLLWHQLINLFNALPKLLSKGQALLLDLPNRYPRYVSTKEIESLMNTVRDQSLSHGQALLSASFRSLSSLVSLSIYLILVPLLVYFFLMDKSQLLHFVERYIPQQRRLLAQVWFEVYGQIGNYVRGKVVEVLIVSIAFYLLFAIMDFDYAILLAVLVGLSVIIPYVGAVLVTIPVFIMAFLQWGPSATLGYFISIYVILIAIDANVLVPLLFSEAVDLHPVAIILAVLFFGDLLGFWGVFFAIPLASVVKAILNVLPHDV